MDEKVTLKDIAKALNISIGTVERAIHGKHDISPETKKLVMDKVRELNYRPNRYARSLSVKNKKKVAVILPYNSFFWYRLKEGMDAAEKEMAYYGVQLEYICLNRVDSQLVLSYTKKVCEDTYDGLVIVPADMEDTGDKLKDVLPEGLAVTLVNDDVPELAKRLYVGPDNELIGKLGGELAGKFTRGMGKCLIVSSRNAKSGKLSLECTRRIGGFTQAVREEYPGMQLETVTYGLYVDSAYSIVMDRIRNDPGIMGIYSADGFPDEPAMAVKESGRRDIVLVGHEMSEEINRLLQEGIVSATICQNPFLQGYHAVRSTIEHLVDNRPAVHEDLYINFSVYTKYNTFGKEGYIKGNVR